MRADRAGIVVKTSSAHVYTSHLAIEERNDYVTGNGELLLATALIGCNVRAAAMAQRLGSDFGVRSRQGRSVLPSDINGLNNVVAPQTTEGERRSPRACFDKILGELPTSPLVHDGATLRRLTSK